MKKINVPGDTYRDHKELIIPGPSMITRIKLLLSKIEWTAVVIVLAIISLAGLVIGGVSSAIYAEVHSRTLAINYMTKLGYKNIEVKRTSKTTFSAGTGCLDMDWELSTSANDKADSNYEVLLCCNADTDKCLVEKSFHIVQDK